VVGKDSKLKCVDCLGMQDCLVESQWVGGIRDEYQSVDATNGKIRGMDVGNVSNEVGWT